MKRHIRLIQAARLEFEASAEWYESRVDGLGERFVESIGEVLERISESPQMFPIVYKGYRKAVVPTFPFVVIYDGRQEEIVVLAVMHAARHPHRWRNRRPG